MGGAIKLGFSKATNSVGEADALFQHFSSVGYDSLQLKPNQYQPYLADPQHFLDRWGTCPGAASALIGYGPLDGEDPERLRRTFAFGRAAGAERVVYCHPVPREDLTHGGLHIYVRMLSELGREARSYGLSLSLRHHYSQPVRHRDEFDVFFAGVEEGTVGLTVDTAHLVKSGVRDIARLIRDLRDAIDNFHLKDFADGEFRVLGTGDIDFGRSMPSPNQRAGHVPFALKAPATLHHLRMWTRTAFRACLPAGRGVSCPLVGCQTGRWCPGSVCVSNGSCGDGRW
jgi:sugar phosphate isomerase/epimerase